MITPQQRAAIDRVKARIREAADVFERIAAYNSEGVVIGVVALHELQEEETQ